MPEEKLQKKYHTEVIECPVCHSWEIAKVEHVPGGIKKLSSLYRYHECRRCEYIITAADWHLIHTASGKCTCKGGGM